MYYDFAQKTRKHNAKHAGTVCTFMSRYSTCVLKIVDPRITSVISALVDSYVNIHGIRFVFLSKFSKFQTQALARMSENERIHE